jgi:hypothetical protein
MRNLSLSLALGVLCTPVLPGWGPEGHEIVADIGLHYLTPAAKARLAAILQTDPESVNLAQLANWADQIRPKRPETAPWHFVDIPLKRKVFDASVDCKGDNCVVAQLTSEIGALKNSQTPNELETLKFLVHFMGDIHQPLHCADNKDRGGNNVHVRFLDLHMNLHKVWDSGLLDQLVDQQQLTADLINQITPDDKDKWSAGTPETWAVESHTFAVKPAYALVPARHGRALPVLDEDYETAADPVVAMQLQKAGVRLAMVLNQIAGSN